MRQTTTRAALRAACGTTMWGIGGVLANIIFDTSQATPAWLVSMRLTWAGIAMLLFAWATKQSLMRVWHDRRLTVRLILFGLIGVALAQFTYLLAIYYGNAALATIMLALVPAIITATTCLKAQAWPRPIDTLAIGIALLGVFLLVTNGNPTELHVAPMAVFWGVIAAITGAAYTLLPRKILQTEPALVVVGWGLIIGSVFMNCLAPVWQVPAGLTPKTWLSIGFIVFGATFLAYILYVSSLKVLRPAIAAMIGNLEPLTATVLSVFCLALGFHAWQFLGIALVLSAVFMMSWAPKKKR